MTEIKSHEFERFAEKPAERFRVFVLYGPDRGLVSERASLIASKTGIDPNDAFASLKLTASDLHGDPGRLLDEVNAIGLFGGEKLVWVKGAANEKALVDALQVLSDNPPEASFLIIEAGDLKKGTGLRKIAEPSRAIAAIPCYADDARALSALIDQELGTEHLRISPAARQRLTESLGGDRIASRNEVRKLALYCRGHDVIEEDDVMAIIGDASTVSADDAVDAILKGDRNAFFHATQKIIASKTPIFLVLQGCLRQFQLLDQMQAEMDDKKQQAGQVMLTLGRGIHFRRKPVIERALRTWQPAAIAREMNRLQAAILQSRQRQSLEESVALLTLLSTTLQASRAG
ncbi:DNA polymerase-3 subunit delta [Rhizobium skierniewicense]|uniref:DNA polymerase III subunit delta n=1 Tax=Rhizobium skierniewicense TaxID=984260 RepID=A0A7W6CAU0_9HYPH|nr:DNA polymerase III subunit delta [Rhizobium skierniewicense]MBB3946412.1 DNA polymerase-3 subunit delta [Rhizobium skierniewicense]